MSTLLDFFQSIKAGRGPAPVTDAGGPLFDVLKDKPKKAPPPPRTDVAAEVRKAMKTELARLFQVFAHLVTTSAAHDDEPPSPPKARGMRRRHAATGTSSASTSDTAKAEAQRQLRRLGLLP